MAESKFNKVRRYYNSGLWSVSRVSDAVAKGWITPEQYFEITGMEYGRDKYGVLDAG